MALSKPLSEIKKDLEEWVVSDLLKAIMLLQAMLSDESDKRNECLVLASRYKTSDKLFTIMVINAQGDRRGAGRGILFREIFKFINQQTFNAVDTQSSMSKNIE